MNIMNLRLDPVDRTDSWAVVGTFDGAGSGASLTGAVRYADGSNTLPEDTHLPVLTMGIIHDLNTPITEKWLDTIALSVDDVNRNTSILPGFKLRYLFYNDRETASGAIAGAVRQIADGVFGIVGGGISSVAKALEFYVSAFNIPLISGSATNDDLSDRLQYPTFARTIIPDRFQGRALAALVAKFGYKTVCTLNYNDDYPANSTAFPLDHTKWLC
jgi:ABC-type branched-subunit amino acid transport system substrate-binding protein